ncbi:hypothetical protein [Actinomyces slackii]|uniref:Uncharacterized protein n=1 Tax=Actinomyces slackii TaxID=52774 RepID=A0A448KEY3_9ACTO|nr:hypothetical protein [Actinomyces slackii]VEG75514.1 Uncharacterised protein [Actinomyces slackii]
MHYSPLATGTGLFILWHAVPSDSVPGLIARILIDIAGLSFAVILAYFLIANLVGAIRTAVARRGAVVGRHSLPARRGLLALAAR